MARFPLLWLRWSITTRSNLEKLWKHPRTLWHWSVTWPWFAVLCLGGIGFIAVNEPAVGLVLLLLSFYSLSAKLWHTRWGLPAKVVGTIGVVVILTLFTASTIAYMEDKPWSNVVVFWDRFVILKSLPTKEKWPRYPPDLNGFPSTMVSIPPPERPKRTSLPVPSKTDPEIRDEMAKQMTRLADDLYRLAKRCENTEDGLPVVDQSIPIGVGKHAFDNNPAALKWNEYHNSVQSDFRKRGHDGYAQRCLHILSVVSPYVPHEDFMNLNRQCLEGTPNDSSSLKMLSDLISTMAQKVAQSSN